MRSHMLSKVVTMSVVAIAMVGLGLEPVVFGGAGEPPTAKEQVMGPSVDGVFTAAPNGQGGIFVAFAGRCGSGNKISVSDARNITLSVEFPTITAAMLENIRIDNPVVQNTCFPGSVGRLITTNVTKFSNDGVVLGGDLSISLVGTK